jgi:drug/metabolite transporter (DMT)-like permease
MIQKLPGPLYLWVAILIFAAANSVTRRLTELGAAQLVDGRNPISLCNVLFVGNLCALLVLTLLHRRQLTLNTFQQCSRQEWYGLIGVAILSGAIAPGLIFHALGLTAVNNVVLIGRLEPVLVLLLSIGWLQERVNRWEWMGAIVAFVGVGLSIALQTPQPDAMTMAGLSLGKGELLTAIGAIVLAVSTVINKRCLLNVPLGVYNVTRTALGTLVFFVLALWLYGPHHFTDVFAPFLWKWMLIYGPVIVVLGQSCWIQGLRRSSVSQASLVSSFTPIAAILAAYLILGEAPTFAHYVGGGVILVGIGLSQIGIQRSRSTQTTPDIEAGVGFKGI